nr:zinc finger, CCHC-type [Tanacetum cinerariifolium]
MDLKTAFLNGELEEEAPKQWHQKFDDMVLSNGYLLNQADKCVYSKINRSGKGVIIYLYVDDMLIFGTDQVQIDLTKEFLSLRPDIAFAVGKLSRYKSNPGTQHWKAIQRASKKQTCITGSTMKSEFVALAAEWLKNLLPEIPLWVKPMASISIRCDSAATLVKAYSQMYNGKSRYLGVRHNMIRDLITNGVVSIEFVRTPNSLPRKLGSRVQCGKLNIQRAESYILPNHPNVRNMFSTVYNSSVRIPSESIPSEEVSSAEYLINGLFQFEPSAGRVDPNDRKEE